MRVNQKPGFSQVSHFQYFTGASFSFFEKQSIRLGGKKRGGKGRMSLTAKVGIFGSIEYVAGESDWNGCLRYFRGQMRVQKPEL